MTWYYAIANQQFGPVPEETLLQLVASGQLRADSLVWREGLSDWRPLGELRPELAALFNMRPQDRKTKLVYASFGARFGAKMLDWTLLQLLTTVALLLLLAWVYAKERWMLTPDLAHGDLMGLFLLVLMVLVVSTVIELAYTWFFLAKYSATPGKMALGLRVVTVDGGELSFRHLLLRLLGERLSNLLFMIGYLMAAFDEPEHRALHDRLSDTRVVKK